MKKFISFIKYNNFFTLALMAVLLGSGVTLAATPAVQDSIISKKDTVRSIDNSYIINADLDRFNANLKINNVTEDADNYYVDYSYTTIALQDFVWRDVPLTKSLNVSKAALAGHDLGVFVSGQLGNIIDSQLAYLKNVQSIERQKGITQKVVATQYSGLIGSMLSPSAKVFQGYVPVVPPQPSDDQKNNQVAAFADADTSGRSQSIPASQQTPADAKADIRKMVEQILTEDGTKPALASSTDATSTDTLAQDPATSTPAIITGPSTTGPSDSTTTTPVSTSTPDTATAATTTSTANTSTVPTTNTTTVSDASTTPSATASSTTP